MITAPLWIWVDLEMTGLDASQDKILEIACIITDSNLKEKAQFGPIAISCAPQSLEKMQTWVRDIHQKSGLLDDVQKSTITVKDAEDLFVNFLKQWVIPGQSILCGNSIWQDKYFLMNHMPEVLKLLHYRILDVSSFKVALNAWHVEDSRLPYPKKNAHRAMDDIRESIAELKFYRENFVK